MDKIKHTHCIIEGCTGHGSWTRHGYRTFHRGYCSHHYTKFIRYGDALHKTIIEKSIGFCKVEGCKWGINHNTEGEMQFCKGFCRSHYYGFKKYGDPLKCTPLVKYDPRCKIEDCQKPSYCRGYCQAHHRKIKLYGDPLVSKLPITYTECKIEGCDFVPKRGKIRYPQGYCLSHYEAFKKYGDPLVSFRSKDSQQNHYLYRTYSNMKTRCYNKKNKAYKHYGARGITVCDRWLGVNGFKNFLEDMGDRPKGFYKGNRPIYSLDRKDNDKGYSKENCKWSDQHEQTANTRNNNDIVGVHFNAKRNRWMATLEIKRKAYTKQFKTRIEAINYRKYLEKIHLHGS